MSDRELLELAAKAAGLEINQARQAERDALIDPQTAGLWIKGGCTFWNPLTDDGQALRLAVKLRMLIEPSAGHCAVEFDDGSGGVGVVEQGDGEDGHLADVEIVRRAIVRAAAEIGRAMP